MDKHHYCNWINLTKINTKSPGLVFFLTKTTDEDQTLLLDQIILSFNGFSTLVLTTLFKATGRQCIGCFKGSEVVLILCMTIEVFSRHPVFSTNKCWNDNNNFSNCTASSWDRLSVGAFKATNYCVVWGLQTGLKMIWSTHMLGNGSADSNRIQWERDTCYGYSFNKMNRPHCLHKIKKSLWSFVAYFILSIY